MADSAKPVFRFKIRNKEFHVMSNDYILDNGACLQLCTFDGRVLFTESYSHCTNIRLTKKVISDIDFLQLQKTQKDGLIYYRFTKFYNNSINHKKQTKMKVKTNDLKKVAKELNEFLELVDPDAGEEGINVKAKADELTEEIKEAATLIHSDEWEDLSDETVKVLTALGAGPEEEEEEEKPKKKSKAKKEEPEEEEPKEEEEEDPSDDDIAIESLRQDIIDADLDELKAIIKANKELFPIAAKGFGLQKNADKLRIKMTTDLVTEEEEPEEEEKPKAKKGKKEEKSKKTEKASTKAPKKEKVKKEKAPKKISAMKFIQTEICKNFKITTEKILAKLEKAGYGTTSERYVDMRRKEALAIITILQELEKLD